MRASAEVPMTTGEMDGVVMGGALVFWSTSNPQITWCFHVRDCWYCTGNCNIGEGEEGRSG